MATINTPGRKAATQARMSNDRVDQLHHPRAATAGDIRALEDIVVDLIGDETPDIVRYGVVESDGGPRVRLVALLPSGVVEGVAALGTERGPGVSSATKRLWGRVTSWGFTETRGYVTGSFSPGDDHPASTTLRINFDDGNEPLLLPMSKDYRELRFTYDELVSMVRQLEQRCGGI